MSEEKKEIIVWSNESSQDTPYTTTTWFRCVGIQEFIEKVQKENKIMGVIFSGNNIGFILDK